MSVPNNAMTKFATTVFSEQPKSITPILGGGNNQLYRIILQNEDQYALKSYHINQYEKDLFRMEREYNSFSFLHSCGEKYVPRAIASDTQKLLAIYSWIEGSPITQISDHDIESVILFVSRLKQYSRSGAARGAP